MHQTVQASKPEKKKKKKKVKLVPDVPGTRTSYIDTYDYTS